MPTHDLTVVAVPVGDLHTYYRNPRRGNTAVIARSLTAHGQYKPVTVNRGTHTGRPNEVLAGNHTVIASRDLQWDTIDAVFVDVDDDEAARIVAIDNRSSDLAENDTRLLLELLADLPDLDGTGYDPGDLDDLAAALDEANSSPPSPGGGDQGGDGFQGENLDERYAAYETSGTHVVILSYPNTVYRWVVEQLGQLAAERELESNADTVVTLITEVTGQTPPDPDDGDDVGE